MKKIIKWGTALLASVWLAVPQLTVHGQGFPFNLGEAEETGEMPQDYHQALGLALESYKDLDQYEVELKLTNTDEDHVVAEGAIIGQQSTGDVMINFDFYDYPPESEESDVEPEPEIHPVRIVGYDDFELMYINQIQWLHALDFFDQPYFTDEIRSEIFKMSDQMVAINEAELARIQLNQPFFESILMLPNPELLTELAPGEIDYEDGAYTFNVERVEIPQGLFSNAGQFQMDYFVQMNVNPSSDETSRNKWEVETTQRMNADQSDTGVAFQFGVKSDLPDELLNMPVEQESSDATIFSMPTFEAQYAIQSQNVTNKMTEVDFYLHPRDQVYELSLSGIAEEFALNILEDEPADVLSANYQLDIRIQPTDFEVPSIGSLDRMTHAEFNYYLEQALNKNVIEGGE